MMRVSCSVAACDISLSFLFVVFCSPLICNKENDAPGVASIPMHRPLEPFGKCRIRKW